MTRQDPEHLYHWRGRNAMGQSVQGQMAAYHPQDLQHRLQAQRVRLLHCHRAAASATRPLTARDTQVFTRQLAALLQAGLPLLQALGIFGQGQVAGSALARLAQSLHHHIEAGASLRHALAQQGTFSDLYLQLVAAGESAGVLDSMLARLADHLDRAQALRGRLRSALAYPVAVLVIAAAVVGVILSWVVPAFETIFHSFHAELPPLTQWVLACSRWVTQYGLALGACLCTLGVMAWHASRRHPRLQNLLARWQLSWPVLGLLQQKICMVRWARTLATLVATGVPLVEALDTVIGVTGHPSYDALTRALRQDLLHGQSLTQALERHCQPVQGLRLHPAPLFSPFMLQMVRVGEESGMLDGMLTKVAEFHEREVNAHMAMLTSLLEPALMAFLGLVIGGLVIAMYLPIFQLGQIT